MCHRDTFNNHYTTVPEVSHFEWLMCVYMFLDRKTTEEKSSSKKDKHSDGDMASIKASLEMEPMETEAPAAISVSSPLLNGQQELLQSEGDTQSN